MSVRAFLEMIGTQSSNQEEKKPALNIGGTSNRLRGGVADGTKSGRKEGRVCILHSS